MMTSYTALKDGDGEPDSPTAARDQYNTYRPEFSKQLRLALGSQALMIANSGLGQVDPSLNGTQSSI